MQKVIYEGKSKIFYNEGDVIYSVHDNIPRVIESIRLDDMKVVCTDGTVLPLSTEVRATEETLKNAKVIDKRERKYKDELEIKIKYLVEGLEKIKPIQIGNWIDLRSAKDMEIKKGEYALIPLGIAMQLPEGFEAYIVPRSSTYKNFKVIQSNSQGVVDNSFCGNEDHWHMPVVALEDTVIHKNDRICQFRVQRIMPQLRLVEVDDLGNESRNGFGSTGVK